MPVAAFGDTLGADELGGAMTKAGPARIFTVFLSSPGDVRAERHRAMEVLGAIQRKTRFLGRAALSVVAWDDPAESTPALLNESPQLTINDYKRPPSRCDLTILILWSRLGTLMPQAHIRKADGSAYASGTEWEVEDAGTAGRPVFAYVSQRSLPRTRSKDEKSQTEALDAWLERTLRNSDGSYAGSACEYEGVDVFAKKLEEHVEQWLGKQLDLVNPEEGSQRLEPRSINRAGVHVPVQLPPPALVGELLGRDDERAQLRTRLARGLHTGVVGPAGFGKTALAAASVRDVVGQEGENLARTPFPDGVVLLDLYRLKAEALPVFDVLAEAFLGAEHIELPADKRARIACGSRRALIIVEGAELADGRDGRLALRQLWDVIGNRCCRLVLTRTLDQVDPNERIELDQPLPREAAERLLRLRTREALSIDVLLPVLDLLQGHPLALTWAGGLLVRGDADPAALVRDWLVQHLPSLREPTQREHTLQWLFQRTVGAISADARMALDAAGLLAPEPFPLEGIGAVFETADQALMALEELVLASLLRRSRPETDYFELTHVLAHRFARREADAPVELRRQLATWLHATLVSQLSVAVNPDFAALSRTLRHVAALLRTDHDQQLWRPLAEGILYDAVDRLTDLGRSEWVASALDAVTGWFACLPPRAADSIIWQRERSVLENQQGDFKLARGVLESALASYEASRAIIAQLAESDPTNLGWQRDLSVNLNNVGDVHRERGDLEGALASFEASRAISARLAESDPTNLGWQRDLSVGLNKVANVQRARGDLQGALASYETARAIRARLAESDRTNMGWQRDLSYVLMQLADVHERQDSITIALGLAEASLKIDEYLVGLAPTHATWQQDVKISRALVERLKSLSD
jgi:tetratricopeptide (TPR) repeat protein